MGSKNNDGGNAVDKRCEVVGGGGINTKCDVEGMVIRLASVVIVAVCSGSSWEMEDGRWRKMSVRWRRLLSEV
jgi:hypothetical protein